MGADVVLVGLDTQTWPVGNLDFPIFDQRLIMDDELFPGRAETTNTVFVCLEISDGSGTVS